MIKMKQFYLVVLAVMLATISSISAEGMLGDTQFAKDLCESWNNSKLPKILGDKKSGGNDWINVVTGYSVPVKQPAGYQKIVSGRKDCKGWPKFELVVEKQADGSAKCTSGGAYNGTKVTWQFLPTTQGWFTYARSFGYGAFMSLWWNGMIGDMFEGKRNQDNFQIFFKLAGQLALKTDYKTGCTGLDVSDVDDAREKLVKAWGVK